GLPGGRRAPGGVELAPRGTTGDGRSVVDEPLRRVRASIEEDVLDALEELRLDVLVDRELSGVDDSHVQAGANRVVEKRRVHRLAYDVVPTERERELGDAARNERARATLLEPGDRLDERLREGRVLLDAGRDREDVRVHHDVFRREPGLLREQVVCTAEDLDLSLDGLRLPALVE